MPDVVSPDVRSRMMAGIGPANTKPEMIVRRGLHALGWRYRLHGRKLPGKPDLVFRQRNALIFVNGCFWHGHACHLFKWPKTREMFWRTKIASNIARDQRVRDELMGDGWRIAEVWECALKGREKRPVEALAALDEFLNGNATRLVVGSDQTVTIDDEA